jgi:hypothetical protein
MKLKSYFLTRKNINEVHQSPYNDTAALKTVSQINNKNDFNINAIYYNKNAECFWYENSRGYLYIIMFGKCLDGLIPSIGFTLSMLTKNDTLKEKGVLWALPIKEFKKIFPDKATAEKFISKIAKAIDDVHIDDAYDIIENICNEFKEMSKINESTSTSRSSIHICKH